MSLEMTRPVAATSYMRALAHPLRLRMLSLLTGAPMSAAELARELGGTHANASYHLKQLRLAGLVELDGQRTVRGGRERRYRIAPEQEVMGQADRQAQDLWPAAVSEELRRRWSDRDPEMPRAHADAELWVEPEVWAQVVGHLQVGLQLLHSSARPPRTPGTVRTSATVSVFGMNDA